MKKQMILSLTLLISSAAFAGGGDNGDAKTITLAALFCQAPSALGGKPDRLTLDRVKLLPSLKVQVPGISLSIRQTPTGPAQRADSGVVIGNVYESKDGSVRATFDTQSSQARVQILSGEGQGTDLQMSCVSLINRGNIPDRPTTNPLIQTDMESALQKLR